MPSKQSAVIIPSGDGFFAVAVDGEIVRAGFRSKGHGAMWAQRQGIYQGTTPRRPKPPIPTEIEDHSIKPIPLLARMTGASYPRFLADAKAGRYGPLYRLGRNGYGLQFGEWKRAIAAREIKVPAG